MVQELSEFQHVIRYKPGKMNIADALSRAPLVTLEQLEFFEDEVSMTAAQSVDPFCMAVRAFIKRGLLPNDKTTARIINSRVNRWILHNNVVFLERTHVLGGSSRMVVVPSSMQLQLVKQAHGSLLGGHRGVFGTFERLALRHYWPTLSADVSKICRECSVCQRAKTPPAFWKHSLQPWPTSERHGFRLHCDLKGPLTCADGKRRYVLVTIDSFSKYVELQILNDKSASEVAKGLFDSWIVRHGAPTEIITDNGREYDNELWRNLHDLFGIKRTRVSALHPASQGLVERFMRVFNTYFRTVLQEHPGDWMDYIAALQLSYNTTVQASTLFTPWRIAKGVDPDFPWFELIVPPPQICGKKDNYVRTLAARLAETKRMVQENITYAATKMKQHYDHFQTRKDREFCPGDEVLIFFPLDKLKKINPKLATQWVGPYLISERVNKTSYLVECNGVQRRQPIHIDRIKRFVRPDEYVRITNTPFGGRNPPSSLALPSTTTSAGPVRTATRAAAPSTTNAFTTASSSSTNIIGGGAIPRRHTRASGPVADHPLPRVPLEYKERRKN